MSEEIQGFRFRASARVAYGEKVRLRFGRSGQQIVAVASDLSVEGMFVVTQDLRPLGTVVEFEIEGREGEVARGLGDVVWARKEKVGPGRHAGMGVQFRYVDAPSRALIAEMVDRRQEEEQDGGQAAPSEVTQPPSPVLGPGVGDKTLAGISAGVAMAGAGGPAHELRLADEVVLADRGGAEARSARPAPATPHAGASVGRRPASSGGFPWLVVVLVVLTIGALVAVWWVWFSDRPVSAVSESAPAATARPAAKVEEVVPSAAISVTEGSVPPAPEAGSTAGGEARQPPVEVISLEVLEEDEGTALLAVTLSRVPGGGGVRVSRLDSPPRLLVRIPEADRVPGGELTASTGLVTAVRAAVHAEQGGTELHLVLDLAGDAVRAESRLDGERLLLRLSNG